jgi:superfamily I DNA/RNA helicase
LSIDATSLNDAQRAAVMHTDGPLLVLAGAGSGKTKVITTRIARLLRSGVDGRSILAVTFTNKAAKEMRERLLAAMGVGAARGLTVSTFHSLCARLLRRDGHRIGLPTGFSILDESDQRAQLLHVARSHGLHLKEGEPRVMLSRIGLWKNLGVRPTDDPLRATPSSEPLVLQAAQLFAPYAQHCRALAAVDFDDLLLLGRELLEQVVDVRSRYHARFRFLHVDEFQDTNPIQLDLIRLLCGAHRNLCVVGDDDQAIYGFRGADVANILGFERLYPGASVVTLEENYRSTGHILACANGVIAHNAHRRDKRLFTAGGDGQPVEVAVFADGDEEADAVAARIDTLIKSGQKPDDIALLYRSAPQSRPFEEALRLHGIPYRVVGGQEFYERRDVKDILAYLACLARQRDELSWRRALSVPSRGLGDKSLQSLFAGLAGEEDVLHALHNKPMVVGVSARSAPALQEFVEALWTLRMTLPALVVREDADVATVMRQALLRAGLQQRADKEPDLEKRAQFIDTLDEMMNAFAGFVDRWRQARMEPDLEESVLLMADATPETLLQAYLDRLALQQDDRDDDDEERLAKGRVTLMSLHASKGLEYPTVFLVGAEEGLLPHRRAIEAGTLDEERRLTYVGITRARRLLVMTRCSHRRKRHELVPRTPSRFLAELPTSALVPPVVAPAIDSAEDFFKLMRERQT